QKGSIRRARRRLISRFLQDAAVQRKPLMRQPASVVVLARSLRVPENGCTLTKCRSPKKIPFKSLNRNRFEREHGLEVQIWSSSANNLFTQHLIALHLCGSTRL